MAGTAGEWPNRPLKKFYTEARGVEGVLFISMDGVSGLEEGAGPIFKDVVAHRCIVHLARNSIRYIPLKTIKHIQPS